MEHDATYFLAVAACPFFQQQQQQQRMKMLSVAAVVRVWRSSCSTAVSVCACFETRFETCFETCYSFVACLYCVCMVPLAELIQRLLQPQFQLPGGMM